MKHRGAFNGYYALRYKIFKRDKFTCQYCGQKAPDVKLEVDHIVPTYEGGTDDEDNLITSCWACNKGKESLSIVERWEEANKTGRNPFKNNPSSQTPTKNLLIKVLQENKSLRTKELAQKMNISNAYYITSRYRRQGIIYRKGREWKLVEKYDILL